MRITDGNDAAIGARLAAARRATGLTQEAAAAAILVTKRSLVYWERGEHSIGAVALHRLARLYGWRMEWFFDPAPPPVSAVSAAAAAAAARSCPGAPGAWITAEELLEAEP